MASFFKITVASALLTLFVGCGMFGGEKTITKVVVIPADQYIVPMVYTNRYGDAIKGYFVPSSKMADLNKMQNELEFFHSPEYYIYSKRPRLLDIKR